MTRVGPAPPSPLATLMVRLLGGMVPSSPSVPLCTPCAGATLLVSVLPSRLLRSLFGFPRRRDVFQQRQSRSGSTSDKRAMSSVQVSHSQG